MILEQDEKTITYGFDFLITTVRLDSFYRKIYESEKAEHYTSFNIHINKVNKEEIHSYFEKHYMDKVKFPSYSHCLKELIYDFLDIPESYEIKEYKSIVGKPTSPLHLNAKEGDVWILKNILMDCGETYKDGIYTIFRNVKDYYNRDESKERKKSLMKMLKDEDNERNINFLQEIYDEFNRSNKR